MTFWRKLQNPFALVGQGFLAGALLFWSTHPGMSAPPAPERSAVQSVLAQVQP